ncbi:MAG TPA: type II toxin-antitoxin system VapC family toxin, partial [bacterium]|nr:type II toxin-antitoxin system VapC family toxin [bacterium]
NIFLRYLTNDIPEKAILLEKLIQKSLNNEVILVSNSLVIAEIIWTLLSFYKFSKDKIDESVSAIVASKAFEFEERDILLQAIDDFYYLNIDFVDAYIGAWMKERQINNIYTLNVKDFRRIDGIIVNTDSVKFDNG